MTLQKYYREIQEGKSYDDVTFLPISYHQNNFIGQSVGNN